MIAQNQDPAETTEDRFSEGVPQDSWEDFISDEAQSAHIEDDEQAMNLLYSDRAAGGDDPHDSLADQALKERQERDERQAQETKLAREELFSRLNERQREAVMMPAQSALVLAAAGSGKTSVLTARIARLVTTGTGSGALPARSVMAVTFTNKAALEMRSRLKKLLAWRAVNDVWIGTFHSLCNRILRDNAKAAGLPKTFAILDVDAQEALCRGILKDKGLTKSAVKAKAKASAQAAQASLLDGDDSASTTGTTSAKEARLAFAGGLSEAALGAKDGGDAGEFVTPSQCAKYISARKEALEPPRPPEGPVTPRSTDIEQLEAVYAAYQERCAKAGLLDFQDLLTRTVSLLKNNTEVREQLRSRFQAILVDEFQDTNAIQYEWLSLLKGPKAHVMAVGDDDQSIYAFRGAKPQNMALFLKELAAKADGSPGRLIKLEENYRSLPYVLDIANAVIANNTERLGKMLRTAAPNRGEKAELVHFPNGFSEAAEIARVIHRMVRIEKTAKPSEIAILYRANQQSRMFEAELNKLGIPLTVYGGFRFYERQEVKHAMAYLDLVNDINHDIAFARVANFPPRGLGEQTIETLRQDAQIQNVSMMGMVAKRAQWREQSPSAIGNATAQKRQVELERFAELVLGLADDAPTMQLHELVQATLERSGLLAHYQAEDTESGSEDSSKCANLLELVSAARQFVLDTENIASMDVAGQLSEYLAHVALMTSTSESDMHAKQTVSLMTVHSSKGLEFDHVWVTGLEEDTFPHARAIEEDANYVPPKDASASMGDLLGGQAAKEETGIISGGPSIQEERRLLYVAVTRARHGLTLSSSAQRLVNGQIMHTKPSRFLRELPPASILVTDLRPQAQRRAPGGEDHAPAAPSGNTGTGSAIAKSDTPSSSLARMLQRSSSAAPAAPNPKPSSTAIGQPTSPLKTAAESAPAASTASISIIGTAGRDKSMDSAMTRELWQAMLDDARDRVETAAGELGRPVHLVSGGAAWADHLAVALFLEKRDPGCIAGLTLHLPAPLSKTGPGFEGPDIRQGGSSGAAASWYHQKFSRAVGIDSLAQLREAISKGAQITEEPAGPGYGAMTRRNLKIAKASGRLLAYTWGSGDAPDDGGTSDTWSRAEHARREHVSLGALQTTPAVRERMRA